MRALRFRARSSVAQIRCLTVGSRVSKLPINREQRQFVQSAHCNRLCPQESTTRPEATTSVDHRDPSIEGRSIAGSERR